MQYHNFFINNNDIVLFDFDDVTYSFYIADFLKARHLIRYICYFQHFDIQSLSEAETKDFEMLRKVIEEDWPIIDFDFIEYSKTI